MPSSNRTTSNTPTLATFKANDTVLCPSIGDLTYKLFHDAEYDCLAFTDDDKTYHYRSDGKVSRDDVLPSIFQDTVANGKAIYALYGEPNTFQNTATTKRQPVQSRQRKTIDMTTADDDEVILMPSIMLSDAACDISGAITVLNDIGSLLYLIYRKEITPSQAMSMARLSHDAADTWADLLCSQLNALNEPLAQSGFGEVASHDG